jgi:hypothetical protein
VLTYNRVSKRLSSYQLLDGIDFIPRIHARKDKFAGRILVGGIDLLDLLDLRVVEAFFWSGLVISAAKLGRIKVALISNLYDAIFYAIKFVALVEDFVMDESGPGTEGNVVLRVFITGDSEEVGAVAVHVKKVNRRSTGNDTIIILWISVGCTNAHTASKRTADIVRVLVLFLVELLDELLAVFGTCVKPGPLAFISLMSQRSVVC